MCENSETGVPCDYDNNGVCVVCGYHKNSEITVNITVADGLTVTVNIADKQNLENGTKISLAKGAEVAIEVAGEGITYEITLDGTKLDGTAFTPSKDAHTLSITVSKKATAKTPMEATLTVDDTSLGGSYATFKDITPSGSNITFFGKALKNSNAFQLNKVNNKCFIANSTEVEGGITQLNIVRSTATPGTTLTLALSKTAITSYDDWKSAVEREKDPIPSVVLSGSDDQTTIATLLSNNSGYGYFAILWISGQNTHISSITVSNK